MSVHSHAVKRAHERHGAKLDEEDVKSIVRDIQKKRALHLWDQSRRRAYFAVRLNGRVAVAVYDRDTKTVRTFLTEEQARETLRSRLCPAGWEQWMLPKGER